VTVGNPIQYITVEKIAYLSYTSILSWSAASERLEKRSDRVVVLLVSIFSLGGVELVVTVLWKRILWNYTLTSGSKVHS